MPVLSETPHQPAYAGLAIPGGVGRLVLLSRYDLCIYMMSHMPIKLAVRRGLRCRPAAERHTNYEMRPFIWFIYKLDESSNGLYSKELGLMI